MSKRTGADSENWRSGLSSRGVAIPTKSEWRALGDRRLAVPIAGVIRLVA